MVEAAVPAGEADSITREGAGIGIVVHDEHFTDVLVAGYAGREVGTGVPGLDAEAAIVMLADDRGIVGGIIVYPGAEMAFCAGFRGLVPVRMAGGDGTIAAVTCPA